MIFWRWIIIEGDIAIRIFRPNGIEGIEWEEDITSSVFRLIQGKLWHRAEIRLIHFQRLMVNSHMQHGTFIKTYFFAYSMGNYFLDRKTGQKLRVRINFQTLMDTAIKLKTLISWFSSKIRLMVKSWPYNGRIWSISKSIFWSIFFQIKSRHRLKKTIDFVTTGWAKVQESNPISISSKFKRFITRIHN